jgi:predicted Fe-Mo cluster-binding NifX family protein
MGVKVAIASTDGKVVNEHFGRAKFFDIVNLTDEGHAYIERRETDPACNGQDDETAAMDALVSLLSDVDVVLVARIGAGAKRRLGDIDSFEIGLPIDAALERLRVYYRRNRSRDLASS